MKKILFTALFAICLTACNGALSLKPLEGEQSIHSEHQEAYLLDMKYSDIGKYAAFASKEGYANPQPVTLSWKGGSGTYEVSISENEDMSDAYVISTKNKKYDFYNGKVGAKYYWNVKNGEKVTEKSSFVIKNTPLRNIYVDGVDNFRDIGGYVTESGKTVKQGLLYRSGHFNTAKLTKMELIISEAGLKTVKDQLKIKTDIDLRKNVEIDGEIETSGIDKSPLGENINYQQLPMYYDGQNILEHSEKQAENLNSVKQFFTLLSNEQNYPMVFHCVQGKDRTGCLAYLLEAMLGIKEVDMYRDYLFTNFSTSVGSACKPTDIDNRYGATIKAMEGSSLQEKACTYLTSVVGLEQSTLNSIKSILLA